ncbi:MAG TPA: metal-dependent transcriptional regulator [Candidatus Eisenbacteria bacterium]
MFAASHISVAQEDYIRTISKLYNGLDPVGVTELAQALGVTPPSVSGMIQRLEAEGFVEHRPRHGVTLTEAGQAAALNIHRRHRLIETFLVQALGLDWAEVHEEAEALEHHLSERVVRAIDRYLGHPTTDPHGHPIPAADGSMLIRDLTPFEMLAAGDAATIREIGSDDPARIRLWKSLGLVPGAEVTVRERLELEGIWRLDVEGREVITGRPGIEGLKVERMPPASHIGG